MNTAYVSRLSRIHWLSSLQWCPCGSKAKHDDPSTERKLMHGWLGNELHLSVLFFYAASSRDEPTKRFNVHRLEPSYPPFEKSKVRVSPRLSWAPVVLSSVRGTHQMRASGSVYSFGEIDDAEKARLFIYFFFSSEKDPREPLSGRWLYSRARLPRTRRLISIFRRCFWT